MNKPKSTLVIPTGTTVEQSRLLRQQQQQARFRNRGGTFVPSQTNPILDLLMTRSVTGESPLKSRRPRASVGKSTLQKGARKSIGLAWAASVAPKASRKPKPKETPPEDEEEGQDAEEEPAKPKRQAKAKPKPKAKPKSKPRATAVKKKASREKPSVETIDDEEPAEASTGPIKAGNEPEVSTEPIKPAKGQAKSTKRAKDPSSSEKDAREVKTRRKQETDVASHEAEKSSRSGTGKRKPQSPTSPTAPSIAIDTERLPRSVDDTESTAPKKKRKMNVQSNTHSSEAVETPADVPPKSDEGKGKKGVSQSRRVKAPPPPVGEASPEPPRSRGKAAVATGSKSSSTGAGLSSAGAKASSSGDKASSCVANSSSSGAKTSSSQAKASSTESKPPPRRRKPEKSTTREAEEASWEDCDQTMTIVSPVKRSCKGKARDVEEDIDGDQIITTGPPAKRGRPEKERLPRMKKTCRRADLEGCDETMTIGPGAIRAAFRESPQSKSKSSSKKPGQAATRRPQVLPDAVIARLKKSAEMQHVWDDEEPDPLDFLS
ncbi:hypothetical protein BDV98DRAFT_583835 [Pterulicium gracile]|uniref:Uncharacterized protein n=1 Tax=Pterulicium gracile TaxID=1884261 RepID=A0A5C3QCU5_9AGAR|nr:hypothetical protein BDV98DRAFT_583835 [Pterula gracilis]